MPATLEGPALDLVQDKNYATLSTLRKDGSIQSVVVWAHVDDDGHVMVNSAEGRAWPANLRRTGHATVTVVHRENPYEWVAVSGELVGDTHEDGEPVIHQLANKYIGSDYPWLGDGEQRVTFRIRPNRVTYVKQG